MEERDSTTPETTKPNYISLLQEIDKLLNLSTNLNNSDISEIETIFDNVTENIDRISNQMTFQKSTMFVITILNTILRISAIDGSDFLISRKPFQSIFEKLNQIILPIPFKNDCTPMHASDILDSMLLNFVKDGLVEICFKRLLSNETALTKDSIPTNEDSSQDHRIEFHEIIVQYIERANDFVCKAVIQSQSEFRNHHSSLMISFQEFVNNCLINSNKLVPSRLLDVVNSILIFVWNLTDRIALIPIFIDIGYIQKSIQWIRTDIFASHISDLGDPIMSIVYNLSRDKSGLQQLRKEKAFDVLMERKQLINDENGEQLIESFGRTLIALSTSDEQSDENKKLILDTTETLYQSCKKADQDTKLTYDGYHLSELLELLHRAFTNTYVIKHILEDRIDEKPTAIQYFGELLLSLYGALLDPEPDELEKRAVKYLLKILLQISSYPEYLKQLIDNNQFCVIIESLANRPRRDDAKRIWCNIQQIISPNESKTKMSSMIYISYDYNDEEFCKEFVNELRKKTTIPIWVDYEKVELCDEMWEYVSPIIISATVVIILVSTAYGDSTDKFQELSYIISTNKSRDEKKGLIVVTTEPNFNFKRSWMKDLLHHKTAVPYENNMGHMASKVCEQIGVAKKSLIKGLRFQVRNVRRKTDDSQSRILNSTPANDSSRATTKGYVQKESSSIDDGTDVLITTRKQNSYSIVAGLMTQTGSAGGSTWV